MAPRDSVRAGRTSRRTFLKLSAISTSVAVLAACEAMVPATGETGGDTAPVEVSFLTQGGGETSFLRYEPLIETFQAENPGIVIKPIWEPGGAIEIQFKLLTLIAAGEGPDTYWAHSYTNAGQAKRDIQMDLGPFLEGSGISEDTFLRAAWLDFQIDGKQIGFPRETTSTILIYNKELLADAGVSDPADGWTWTDFEAAATAMTSGEGTDRIFGTADWNINRNTWIKMWQKGGDVLSEDRSRYTMNEEASVAEVNTIKGWHAAGVHVSGVEKGGFSTGDLFTTGRIGMFPQFSVFSNVAASEFEWDIAHLPRDPDDQQTTRVASAGHSMWSGTEHPDEAWTWFQTFATVAAFEHWVGTGLNIPSLKAVAGSSNYMTTAVLPPSAQVMLDAFDYGRPAPVAGDWIGVPREVQPALNSLYGVEDADAQTALDNIADRVNDLIAFVPSA